MHNALRATTALFLAMSSAGIVQAVNSAAPPPSSSESAPIEQLPEVIVTAQREVENSQRAAVAISVLQGADLIDAGLTQVDRLSQLVPALTVEPTSTGNLMFMRGVGNFTVTPNSDPAIAFNYDGVYVGRPTSTTGVFFDLDRIEVLKGPQGTLYGRNATGGAINVLPAQPKFGDFSSYATASFGNYNSVTAEGALNIPLSDKSALRISASTSSHDGYLKDGTSDDRTSALRVQVKAEVVPALTVRVAGDYSQTGGAGSGVSYLSSYVYSPALGRYTQRPSGLSLSEGVYSPDSQAFRLTIPVAGRTFDALSPMPFQNNSFYGANSEIAYETGLGTLTITPAWRYASLNYLSDAAAFLYRQIETDEQYSFEARLSAKSVGMFDYTIGGYYFDERIKSNTALSLSSAATYSVPNYQTHSFAPFGRLTAHLSDALRLVGGLRYTKDKKSFDGNLTSAAIVCRAVVAGVTTCPTAPLIPLVDGFSSLPFAPLPAIGGAPLTLGTSGAVLARTDRVDNSHLTSSRVTYRTAVEYDVAPQSLLYASFETGYRSGGFSAAQGFETYQPEYLNATTIGLKNRFFDSRVQLNVEAFHWDYQNQQINHVGLDLAGRSANFTQNIGKSRIQGIDIDGEVLATSTTLLSADIQYLDAKNQSFVYQQGIGTAPPLTGCAVSVASNPALYNVDCSGFASYNSPKWTINLAAQQTFDINDYKLVLGADTQYKSQRNTGFAYLPEQVVGSTWTSNAQVSFGPASDRWSIAAYVRNIENHRIPVYSSFHPSGLVTIAGTSAPMTFGVRVSGKF